MNTVSNMTNLHSRPAWAAISLALLLNIGLYAQEEIIEAASKRTEIEMTSDKPVRLWLASPEGEISVVCEERSSVEVVIDEFEADDPESNQAVFEYNPIESTLKVKLKGELVESDVALFVPLETLLELESADGDIKVFGSRGDLDVATADGDISLVDVTGAITANAVDGDIEIGVHPADEFQPISAATVDGDIILALPAGTNAELQASTVDGVIECELPMQTLGGHKDGGLSNRQMGFNRTKATINDGGARIALRTIDGDIAIHESTP